MKQLNISHVDNIKAKRQYLEKSSNAIATSQLVNKTLQKKNLCIAVEILDLMYERRKSRERNM